MRVFLKNSWIALLVFCCLSGSAAFAAPGQKLRDKVVSDSPSKGAYEEEARYWDELDRYSEEGIPAYKGEDVVLLPSGADVPPQTADYEGKSGVFLWDDSAASIAWTLEIPDSALYRVEAEYRTVPGSAATIERTLEIGGRVPFYEAYSIHFPRLYANASEPLVNALGDEVKPAQKEIYQWQTLQFSDKQGLFSAPFAVLLEQGKQTLSLDYVNGAIALSRVTLKAMEELPAYEEVRREYERLGYRDAGQSARLEAEDSIRFCSHSASGMYADGDPAVVPRSLGSQKMNAVSLGDAGNHFMSWNVTVPEDGLYQIMLRVKQNWGDGLSMYRRISIDGKVPFQEFACYSFVYSRDWRSELLADEEGNPYLVYLTAGTAHELRMTAKTGDEYNTRMLRLLTESSETLSELLMRIRMVTGASPDINYDYELAKKIPDLPKIMDGITGNLERCREILAKIGKGKKLTLSDQMELIQVQLREMKEDPFVIARRMDELSDCLTKFGSWISGLTSQPLALDYLELQAPGTKPVQYRSGFFQIVQTVLVNFINSFVKDYDSVSAVGAGGGEGRPLEVWIGRGKDWGELAKQLSDSSFTAETGVDIHVNVLPTGQLNSGAVNSLMLAIAGGAAPDVCMGVSSSSPGEFAIRNAVADLKQFPAFSETAAQFYPESLVPFQYRGGVYALPETINFKALFYRKDITANLGIRVPETWDDLIGRVLPVLNQNSMQFYLQSVSSISTVAAMYEVFMYQNGGTYYSEDYTKSALDSAASFRAFQKFCDLFIVQGFDTTLDFLNRMKSGEVPMGIADFNMYMTLTVAAPELAGRWAIAEIPGTRRADGTVDRTTGGNSAECAVIMEQSRRKSAAWDFLRWWVSSETQGAYAAGIEAKKGVSARWPSANIRAFDSLPWSKAEGAVIKQSLSNMREVPVVVGSYFTSRHIGNAWNNAVVNGMNLRGALEKAVKDIDKELKRKQEQYKIH